MGSGLDVYLFPQVVGGGWGDIVEVREAGSRLAQAGFPVFLYRAPGRPLPAPVATLFEGLRFPRISRPAGRHAKALTVAPMWGVSAAPARPEPFGRAGAWAEEGARIESLYGPGRVLHVSLEEFARTLTSREETIERYREGGRPLATIRRFVASEEGRREIARFRAAYRTYRAFDRPDLLHLFASFHPSRAFQTEYPEAVQTGPLWPPPPPPPRAEGPGSARRWVWYASPSTSVRIAEEVIRGVSGADPPIELRIRAPRSEGWPSPPGAIATRPVPVRTWAQAFASAEMRIVTGSRTLLEALAVGGPFLYFNGTLGSGRSRRRHRPEKIRALLAAWRSDRVSTALRADLETFSRGRRVEAIVRRAAFDPAFRAAFPRRWRPEGFAPPFDDAGRTLVALARRFARAGSAETTVAEFRRRAARVVRRGGSN